jgi:4-oxalocrotonate tautomerase
MINVQYATPKARRDLVPAIAAAVGKLTNTILGKPADVIAISVEEEHPANWFIAGKSLEQHQLAAFWVDVRVTDGTNEREEKAAFVAAMFEEMKRLLGPLHNECYVHVDDVRGDAYGYGGLTQNERFYRGKFAAEAKAGVKAA